MAILAEWIEHAANGEPIEAVVIGEHDRDGWGGDTPAFNAAPINKQLAWDEAKKFLSYEFDNGFGGADCHPIVAWTASRVIGVHEYDCATSITWYPRNPVGIRPHFDGAAELSAYL